MSTSEGNRDTSTLTLVTAVMHISEQNGCSDRHIDDGGGLATFAVIVGVCLICENLLLINVIVRTRTLHTNTNILVASLAITDVLVGVQVCIMGLSEQPTGLRSWLELTPYQVRIFDSFLTGLNYSLVTVSITHLSVLTLDRYLYLLWPFHYQIRVTRRKVLATAGILWTLGLVYLLSAIIILRKPEYHMVCIIWDTPAEYGTWPLVSVYVVSMFVVFASTKGITNIALRHRRKRQPILMARKSNPLRPFSKGKPMENDGIAEICTTMKSPSGICQISKIDCGVKNIVIDSSFTNMNLEDTTESGIVKSVNYMTSNIRLSGNSMASSQSGSPNTDANVGTYVAQDETLHEINMVNSTLQRGAVNSSKLFGEKNDKTCNAVGAGLAASNDVANSVKEILFLDMNKSLEQQSIVIRREHTGLCTSSSEVEGKPAPANTVDAYNKIKQQEGSTRLLSKENVKIIKFVFIMCGCFLLCTLIPLFSFVIKSTYPDFSVPKYLNPVMLIMLGSNSGMNFLIITLMNKDFRASLIKTLPRCRLSS
ncbi:hypothetical protein RRG08_008200 [Elysia crispata]|uniref:G-protein coupled receptors family 1 profile domain-containing protein n=1 Tax=Elysia crispata TaxID=231223 RepID=A0AAE1CZ20_9GAST|nr:hypothetical protein RRG08_008200 [Elysia crispata]